MAYTFSFIGTGSMGGALAKAAARKLPKEEIFLCNRTASKAAALAEELGCAYGSAAQAAGRANMSSWGSNPR